MPELFKYISIETIKANKINEMEINVTFVVLYFL